MKKQLKIILTCTVIMANGAYAQQFTNNKKNRKEMQRHILERSMQENLIANIMVYLQKMLSCTSRNLALERVKKVLNNLE